MSSKEEREPTPVRPKKVESPQPSSAPVIVCVGDLPEQAFDKALVMQRSIDDDFGGSVPDCRVGTGEKCIQRAGSKCIFGTLCDSPRLGTRTLDFGGVAVINESELHQSDSSNAAYSSCGDKQARLSRL